MTPVFQKASKMNAHLKDVMAVVLMIVIYNLCISIAYDSLQYINWRKVVVHTAVGVFAFVPMYTILWATFRKMKSALWFFITSWLVWAVEPILMSQGHSNTFNAWQGKNQIYENGNLTFYGYFHGLQNPFFFLALYATIILTLHLYKKFQHKKTEGLTHG